MPAGSDIQSMLPFRTAVVLTVSLCALLTFDVPAQEFRTWSGIEGAREVLDPRESLERGRHFAVSDPSLVSSFIPELFGAIKSARANGLARPLQWTPESAATLQSEARGVLIEAALPADLAEYVIDGATFDVTAAQGRDAQQSIVAVAYETQDRTKILLVWTPGVVTGLILCPIDRPLTHAAIEARCRQWFVGAAAPAPCLNRKFSVITDPRTLAEIRESAAKAPPGSSVFDESLAFPRSLQVDFLESGLFVRGGAFRLKLGTGVTEYSALAFTAFVDEARRPRPDPSVYIKSP